MEQKGHSLSLTEMIQAFKDDKRQNAMMPWNNGNPVQFSPLQRCPKTQRGMPLVRLGPDGQTETIDLTP